MLDKSDASGERPAAVVAAQRRVMRAIAELPPPANFSVLIECMAQEMVHAGLVPSSPMFESFAQMQIRALIQRVRGICAEQGIELEEEVEAPPTPTPRRGWLPWGR